MVANPEHALPAIFGQSADIGAHALRTGLRAKAASKAEGGTDIPVCVVDFSCRSAAPLMQLGGRLQTAHPCAPGWRGSKAAMLAALQGAKDALRRAAPTQRKRLR